MALDKWVHSHFSKQELPCRKTSPRPGICNLAVAFENWWKQLQDRKADFPCICSGKARERASFTLKEFMVSFKIEPWKMKPISSEAQAPYWDENPWRFSFPALKVKPLIKSYNSFVKNDHLQHFTEATGETQGHSCVFSSTENISDWQISCFIKKHKGNCAQPN